MLVDIGELVDWLQNSIKSIANYHRTVVLDCKSSPADVFPRTQFQSVTHTRILGGLSKWMNEWMNLCFCLDTLCSFIWPTHCKLCVLFAWKNPFHDWRWISVEICRTTYLLENLFTYYLIFHLPLASKCTVGSLNMKNKSRIGLMHTYIMPKKKKIHF